MKKAVLIFLTLSGVLSKLDAQISYFENDPVWRLTHGWSQDGFNVIYTYYTYYVDGDTLVNDTAYHKMYTHRWNDSEVLGTELKGLVRQEERKVFARDVDGLWTLDNTDQLIYDFGLEVGDTIPQTPLYLWPSNEPTTVESIDSLLIGDNYHRIINSNDIDATLLEGVGHAQGFFEGMGIPFDHVYYLECYHKNNSEIIFSNEQLGWWGSGTENCDLTISIEEINDDRFISVFPNPSNGLLKISCSVTIKHLSVIDIFGQKVMQVDKPETTFQLAISGLKSGLYTLSVQLMNGETNIKRLIKE